MPKGIKKIIIIFSLLFAIFTAVNFVLAADPDTLLFGGLQNQVGNAIGLPGGQDPRVMAANIIRVALGFLGLVAVGIVIYAGWLWMTAAGDAQKIDKAKKVLLGALIGLLLIVASFGIVTFILGKILESVGGGGGPCVENSTRLCGCGGTQTCTGGAWGVCAGSSCGGPGSFYVTSKMPTGSTVMNAKVRYYFSNNVDSLSVDSASLSVVGLGGLINGNYITTANRVEFIPNGICPLNSCGATNCFLPNDSITVTATNGILDMIGTILTCTLANPCIITFTTNNSVDCNKPSVSLLYDTQVCLNTANNLGANASDDSGVSQVDFTDSNGGTAFTSSTLIPCSGGPCGQLPSVWNIAQGTVTWQPTFPTYSAGTNYTITATADDIDSNQVSASQTFNLRPDHCCNGVQDGDETGVDCGGSCAGCVGAACAIDKVGAPSTSCSDTLCASGFCTPSGSTQALCTAADYDSSVISCCLCQDSPIIDWVTPMGGFCDGSINTSCQSDSDCSMFIPATCNTETPNGYDGNLVTIGGRFFGTFGPGSKVEFSDDNGNTWKPASLADIVNSNCNNSWQDTQIIVVVPPGLLPDKGKIIRVTAGNGFSDITNDFSRGAILDFVINTISRPGLCKLNPDNGKMDDIITYEGIRLTNNIAARFGNTTSYINALNNNTISPTQHQADVPNIATGQTTTYVINALNINSNFLNFTKDAEAPLGPKITSFEPVQGPPDQYVTIRGSGFGATRGTSRVFFGPVAGGDEANYSFPVVCANSVWSDNQVIVKVPTGLGNGNYVIFMEIGTWPAIDTSALTPSIFNADNTLPLAPSLCKLDPVTGPNNSSISLYGEYFGAPDANSKVRFHLNHNQIWPAAISFWGTSGDADRIDTTVHNEAVTGPVKAVKDLPENVGNGLNFTVGNCTDDADCGGTTCCPAGSFKANMCASDLVSQGGNGSGPPPDIDDCYVKIGSSVYEWDFSTGAALPVSTCAGYSLNQCALSNFCPNSPGECSPYAGGVITAVGNCSDADCNGVGACTASCTYNSSLNKCVDLTQNCSLNGTTQDALGKTITKYCALYNGFRVWHIDTPASCPATWTRIPGNKCVDSIASDTCDLCSSGFKCADVGGVGQCVVDQNICPTGSTCNAGVCEKTDKAQCECCCDIGDNLPTGENPSCCAPLTCSGICGDDMVDDGTGFGMCSGCALAGTTQAEHNAACNCAGTTGKVCDVNDPIFPSGVCKDGATTGQPCYDSVNGATCDPTNPPCALITDFCDASQGCTCQPIIIGTPCDEDPIAPGCNIISDICDVVPGLFCDPTSGCTCQSNGAGGGARCFEPVSPVCNDSALPTCSIFLNYQCLDKVGSDCRCCCDPTNIVCSDVSGDCTSLGLGDPCGTGGTCQPPTNAAGLQCSSDKAPCDCDPTTSPCNRGLFCGCSSDAQCVDTNNIGCGFDTCCHGRPTAQTVSPADGSIDICRNALLTAKFDQTMDISSFSGNVIVVGDYETGLCPAGTEYILASGQKEKGFFARLFQKIAMPLKWLLKSLFPRAEALTNNFCAITGTVSGAHNADNTTTLTFSPSSLLDANRKYYVIIKGDSDLTDAKKEGVKSYYDVTMADSWPDLNGDTIIDDNDRTLNGVKFYGYVWSFTTRNDSQNNGVCKIDHVEISPSSYLFQTIEDDINENDTDINDASFDTKKDRDKVFTAKALSSDNQELASVAGVYEWTWNWTISNSTVIGYNSPNPYSAVSEKQLIEAQAGITDGFSELEAQATVSGSAASVGEFYSGTANVWVFICENPWPPVDSLGLWAPWSDAVQGMSCLPSTGSCFPTNYELYYCRDTASTGTADDLPAILSTSTIIRGSSTVQNLLKEYYFFRETAPSVSGGINLNIVDQTTTPDGKVLASWTAVAGASGYKVYYGTQSGSYSNYTTTSTTSLLINNLTVGTTYYFTVTAYDSATGAESGYSTEVSITPQDTTPPLAPTGLIETDFACEGKAFLSWNTNSDDTKGYKVYYGATSGVYGAAEDVKNATEVTLDGLPNNTTYYFAVTAYDSYNNESGYSWELSTVAMPDCDMLISWWKFDEGSGTTALDSKGSNDGTLNGGVSWTNDAISGQALKFDGVDDYVNTGSDSSLDDIDVKTIVMWVKPKMNLFQYYPALISKTPSHAGFGWNLIITTNTSDRSLTYWQELGANGAWNTLGNLIYEDNWYHIAVVYNRTSDTNDPIIYINGISQSIDEWIGTPSGNAVSDAPSDLWIGANPLSINFGGLNTYNGIIDEVRIYNQSLSLTQIKENYENGLRAHINNSLVSNWKFDEGSGTTAFDSKGTNDGGLINGVNWDINGVSGSALDFDGSSGYVDVGNGASLTSLNAFTYSVWFKGNDVANACDESTCGLIDIGGYPSGAMLSTYRSMGKFYLCGPPNALSTPTINNNTLYNLVGTYYGTTMKLYLNSVLTDQGNKSTCSFNDKNYIGKNGLSDAFFDGLIDEVSVYNEALTLDEISILFDDYNP